MIPRSYASDGNRKWLLFAREAANELIFTVILQQDSAVMGQTHVDADGLEKHSEELGLEIDAHAFRKLLLRALEQRSCVDVEIETENGVVKEFFLALTYEFGPSISRKGYFQLPIVAHDVPQCLVDLLSSIHAEAPQPILSEQQKAHVEATRKVAAAAESKASGKNLSANFKSTQETNDHAAELQSSRNEATLTMNPMILKRRHMPAGTMRRRGSKGAKLVKK